MTHLWARVKSSVLISAVALVCLIAGERSSVSQPQAPVYHVAPYFVTWHVTGRAFREQVTPFGADSRTEGRSDRWDLVGSAIVRMYVYDESKPAGRSLETHYLTMAAHRSWKHWTVTDVPKRGNYSTPIHCTSSAEGTIADAGSYAGLIVTLEEHLGSKPRIMGQGQIGEGPTLRFNEPLSGLAAMYFLEKVRETSDCDGVSPNQWEDAKANPLAGVVNNGPDLSRDPNNPSSFHADTQSTDGSGLEMHWVAHAYPLGACAHREGPIQEGDSVITHEDIDVDIANPVITPDGDGEAYVRIRVTCDQVPIEKAPVEVTLDVVENSGYHQHSPDRPLGQLDGQEMKKDTKLNLLTDADGYAYAPASKAKSIKFEPPPLNKQTYRGYRIGIAGTYEVTAKTASKKVPESSETVPITAKIGGLGSMGPAAEATRGAVGNHKIGSWAKPETIDAFKNLASDVEKYQRLHNAALDGCQHKSPWIVSPVSFNDISLPDGGLFDLDENWKVGKGHQSHNKGDGGDFNRFGAGRNSNKDFLGTGTECNNEKVKITPWLIHVLLDLGEKYGTWDRHDMGGYTGSTNDKYPEMPKLLHLHVADAGEYQ